VKSQNICDFASKICIFVAYTNKKTAKMRFLHVCLLFWKWEAGALGVKKSKQKRKSTVRISYNISRNCVL